MLSTFLLLSLESFGDSNWRGLLQGGYKKELQKQEKSISPFIVISCNGLPIFPAMSLFLTFHPSFTLCSFQKPSAAQNHADSRALNLLHGPVYP